MPLFFSHIIDAHSRLAVWHIAEPEDFFLEKVPLSRSITHPHKRLQHLAGRYLLQHLFPDFPIHLIQIADTRKPYLEAESHHFSISHCGDYAAAIVSTQRRVGIDIELHTERIEKIQHKFLNQHEIALGVLQSETFPTFIWSLKEAMYKWYGLGEMDFQEHLQVKEILPPTTATATATATVKALISKGSPIELMLHGRQWDNLLLSWVCS